MKRLVKAVAIMLLMAGLTGCDSYKDETKYTYDEVVKDFHGQWQLVTVKRNGTDITEAMDFSRFKINLNEDGTYTLENYLPFIVKNSGTWRTDDPEYPFHLVFKENGQENELQSEIKYVTNKGKREVSLTLSPGHESNKYVYVLKKNEQ